MNADVTHINAHPNTTLPEGYSYGAHASGPGWEGHWLLGSTADIIIVERPDYDTEDENARDLAASIADAECLAAERAAERAAAEEDDARQLAADRALAEEFDRHVYEHGIGTDLTEDEEAAIDEALAAAEREAFERAVSASVSE